MLTESGKIIVDDLVGFQDGDKMDRPRNDRLWIPICQQLEEGKEESEQGRGSRAGGTGCRRILVCSSEYLVTMFIPSSMAEAN